MTQGPPDGAGLDVAVVGVGLGVVVGVDDPEDGVDDWVDGGLDGPLDDGGVDEAGVELLGPVVPDGLGLGGR